MTMITFAHRRHSSRGEAPRPVSIFGVRPVSFSIFDSPFTGGKGPGGQYRPGL